MFINFFFSNKFLTNTPTVAQIEGNFLELYQRIRGDRMFSKVPLLILIENKNGNDHNLIAGFCARTKEMTGYRILCQKPGKIGFDTTEQSKVAAFGIIRDYASAGGIVFYENLISFGTDHGPACTGPAAMRDMLIKQIGQLRQYGKKAPRLTKSEVVITAIHGRDGKRIDRLNDDVLMAFGFVMLWGMLQRKGSLSVKPEEVRRMHMMMVHDYERAGAYEQRVDEVMREENRRKSAQRRGTLFQNSGSIFGGGLADPNYF